MSAVARLAAPDRTGSKIRRSGGGPPVLTRTDPSLLEDLRGLLESTTLGDPTRPLIWVSKSHAKLALAREGLGHRVSATRSPQLLERLGYRRQVNRKSLEGGGKITPCLLLICSGTSWHKGVDRTAIGVGMESEVGMEAGVKSHSNLQLDRPGAGRGGSGFPPEPACAEED